LKDEFLFQAHQYLDGELSDQECKEFEGIMKDQPELARYVKRLRNMDDSLRTALTVQAPQMEIPRGSLSRFTDLLTVRWRVPAVPVILTCLLLAAFFLWKGIPETENPTGHHVTDVKLVYFSKTAKSVAVVGSFNSWNREVNLHSKGDNGYWVVQIPVSPGEYSYSFIVDGKIRVADPTADSFKEDDFGSKDSIMRVGV